MTILYIVILLLVVIIVLLTMAMYLIAKKSSYLSDKEKDFIKFVIDIFTEYGDDLGIQSKEEHEKIANELEKIKKKLK